MKIVLLKRFDEFKKINEEKKDSDEANSVHVDKDRKKDLDKMKKHFDQKWVCLIVTDSTKLEFEKNYPGKPFDIRFGSHRILLNNDNQFEKAKINYKVGNIYKKEVIKDVNFHHYNPLIDSNVE